MGSLELFDTPSLTSLNRLPTYTGEGCVQIRCGKWEIEYKEMKHVYAAYDPVRVWVSVCSCKCCIFADDASCSCVAMRARVYV